MSSETQEQWFEVRWTARLQAKNIEEAAEIAAAILFDQAQEHLELQVDNQKVELINGVAHPTILPVKSN